MAIFDRVEFLQELQLRKVIRKGISVVMEKKKEARKQALLEENQLRQVIRKLIKETTAVADNDPAPHKATGINVLEDLLKKIIPVLEIDFKKLTAFLPPLEPLFIISSSKCSKCVFRSFVINPLKLNISLSYIPLL